jgi:osmoprotectant transport system substrate-binding protein
MADRQASNAASPAAAIVTSHVKSTWSSAKHLRLATVAAVTEPLLAGCSSSSANSPKNPLAGSKASGSTVVVGSSNFAESILITEIYGEALKAKGIKVSYQPNISSRETTYGLLKNGSLTVLPEYNGALLALRDPGG